MRFVIQRVKNASVTIDGEVRGAIDRGLLVLVGISHEDDEAIADKMVQKMLRMRIFEDLDGKTNLGLQDVEGELLIVSQFTLYANCRKGNRPSFTEAAKPDRAEELYEYIKKKCAEEVPGVKCGEFGADMKVQLLNDGPFTILLDSDDIITR